MLFCGVAHWPSGNRLISHAGLSALLVSLDPIGEYVPTSPAVPSSVISSTLPQSLLWSSFFYSSVYIRMELLFILVVMKNEHLVLQKA